MKRSVLLFAILLCCAAASNSDTPKRPHISGIGIVSLVVSPPKEAIAFYHEKLGFGGGMIFCASICTDLIQVNPHQQLSVLVGHPDSVVKEDLAAGNSIQVTFETSDAEAMRAYLKSREVSCSEIIHWGPESAYAQFFLDDPDGHHIGFIQYEEQKLSQRPSSQNQTSSRLIHAGFVVRDRAAMDRFYKDILGFHLYWQGGRKDDETDWVNMQVPDGTDWIEYMLNVPTNADKHTLGVMNHIALGVPDIHVAEAQLRKNGWTGSEEPKIGRGGKWQLNLYDPDDTRVELMEFTPTQKPCCSEYTGPHPKP
jgi:catechol 2,3-dioxygenase-like lactoylglutathione lyase family enzyme